LLPEKILVLEGDYAGKTLKESAQVARKDPSDVLVDLASKDRAPTAIIFQQDLDYVRQLAKPEYVFTASDGLTHLAFAMKAHPRMYGTFTRKIRQFALDEKLVALNAAIRSMTSLPAEKFNMKDRGRISEGSHADIAVISLNTVADVATYQKPDEYSTGIQYLLVNGVLEIDKGRATGERGGRALKREE
jgi:N-acyl-D-amino-acid deacylase